jgi:protein TonB
MFEEEHSPEAAGRPWIRNVAFGATAVLIFLACALLLVKFLSGPGKKASGVHQVALIKQPPTPPPKPPEKQPDPPKVKEEVKIDQPKDVPKPDEPKAADEKPASDKPLGVDAEGGPGNDGFGLAGNKGGRDLLTTGAGGGAYYSGLLQRHFTEALSRNRKVLKDQFRVVVSVWFGDDGRVQRADIVNGSGDAQVDDLIRVTLLDMSPLKDVPPASMRPIQVRLSNRS